MTPLAYIGLGILGGVFVTAPLGPVNVMIMQRAFRYGFMVGLAAGIGASLADVAFATAAAFGISTVSEFVEGHSRLIQLIGGLLIILFGSRILWRQPGFGHPLPVETRRRSPAEVAVTTFFLTITNPATVFGFIAYFSALGEWGPDPDEIWGTVQLLVGVALGTLGWWCGLAAVVTRLRVRITESTLAKVNVIAGALLVGFGALILGRLSVTYFGLI
ncbi:LysE family transporter [Acuticoccus sp. M5D2P5]|uniref:LysE family translocator n=1 Tax=Acuticoccus kalidii TaxID=2910977 RepID=UPI001F1B22B2|nr:LysE family transporter [Acuticoccus kalidii]MCF3936097.1 LysE family transporter [Acuticoccus kalidii]